ncbi:MAG: TrkH family potassium uptake protein [Bacteroidetes bacterium]|nr:TrkH family potassium uptake protein [Bacteroidota bacterium]
MNWKIILRTIGILLLIEGGFIFTCLPFSYYYGGDDARALIISGVITLLSGFSLLALFKSSKAADVGKKEGYFIVASTWMIMSLFGGLPYMIHGSIPSLADAFFEAMSGFTTTGASILTDVEALPKGLLFWRAMTHWIGGMGIIVFTIAILPIFGFGGMQLFAAESPGPTKDKLQPRIKETARLLWGIYVFMTFLETILLMLGGMNLWESLCLTFSTVATGGFGTRNTSIGDFSPFIQYVITIFMILAGTHFSLHYFMIRGKFKLVWRNQEFRFYLFLILISTLVIWTALGVLSETGIESSFRLALFQVVSILTTTGFATADYLLWPPFTWFLLFLLMFIGGMAGSTAGSVKVVRVLLFLKVFRQQIRKSIHPNMIRNIMFNDQPVQQTILGGALTMILLYLITFAGGTLALIITNVPFLDAAGSAAACLGNVGPGLGAEGPVGNYAHLTALSKWILSILMYMGRLELFSVLILFAPSFWKK